VSWVAAFLLAKGIATGIGGADCLDAPRNSDAGPFNIDVLKTRLISEDVQP
jgi:hypothetical protein